MTCKNGRVYFMQDEAGRIKIGHSAEPLSRLQTVQGLDKGRITLLASMPGDTFQERALHRQFAAHRIEGEWFWPADELLAHIGTLPPAQGSAMKTKKINPAFGAGLQALREEAGLSQAALAQASGVPVGTIREYEQGRREPLFSAMQKLAPHLKADLDALPSPLVEGAGEGEG
jgi:DNA-binding XRE family transcriptional regulator